MQPNCPTSKFTRNSEVGAPKLRVHRIKLIEIAESWASGPYFGYFSVESVGSRCLAESCMQAPHRIKFSAPHLQNSLRKRRTKIWTIFPISSNRQKLWPRIYLSSSPATNLVWNQNWVPYIHFIVSNFQPRNPRTRCAIASQRFRQKPRVAETLKTLTWTSPIFPNSYALLVQSF